MAFPALLVGRVGILLVPVHGRGIHAVSCVLCFSFFVLDCLVSR